MENFTTFLRRVLAGGERDVPPAGPGRTGRRATREMGREPQRAPLTKMRAQPAPLARAAGGKRDVSPAGPGRTGSRAGREAARFLVGWEGGRGVVFVDGVLFSYMMW